MSRLLQAIWARLGRSQITRYKRRIADLETGRDRALGLHREVVRQRDRQRALHEDATQQRDRARSLHEESKQQRDRARQELRSAREQARNQPFEWWDQVDALRDRSATGLRPLRYHPPLMLNPLLPIWYSRMPEAGFDARPLPELADIEKCPPNTVLHLHWVRLSRKDDDASDVAVAADHVVYRLRRFVEGGGTLVWTIHEALSHDTRFPEIEAKMRAQLADLAHGIHLLHPSTLDEVAGLYPIDPRKAFVVRQPFYVGYPDYTTRAAARGLLGLEENVVALLAFGAIRPYKGFDRIVALLPVIREESGLDVRLLVAGPALDPNHAAALRDDVAGTPGASMTEGAVGRDHVQTLFRAADLAVLPYRAIHNSGSVMLNLVFGTPTVAPGNPVIADIVESGMVRMFDGESDDDLVSVIVAAIRDRASFPRALPPEFQRRHDPGAVALELARQVRRIADAPDDWWEAS